MSNVNRVLSFKKIIHATLSILCLSHNVHAYNIDIKITGEIHIPPCVINNGNSINVDFGKISLQKVDGLNYKKITTVSLQCDYFEGTPYIAMKGNVIAGGDTHTLDTFGKNAGILGISLYQGDTVSKIVINSTSNGPYGHKITAGISSINTRESEFSFSSVPIKIGHHSLQAGEFTSIATLEIHYI